MPFWISLSAIVVVLGMLLAAKIRRIPTGADAASADETPSADHGQASAS
jgi:hypothetical protein